MLCDCCTVPLRLASGQAFGFGVSSRRQCDRPCLFVDARAQRPVNPAIEPQGRNEVTRSCLMEKS